MYEVLFRNLLFPFYEGVLKRRHTHRFLAEYERSQWLDPVALEALQLRKLNALLDHCWRNVPFLEKHWRQAGLRPGSLGRVADLAHFPPVTKAMVRANSAELRARVAPGRVFTKTTGGSTGEPLQFEYSEESYARRTAVMWRGYRWCGTDIGRRTAYLWGAALRPQGLHGVKDDLYHRAFNRLILNSFAMSEENLPDYVRRLNAFRPRIVVGYVAPLAIMARHALSRGIHLHRPQAVITGAEALTPMEREQIEGAFGAPVYETYGCREVMLMGCECEKRRGLHLSSDHLVLETLVDGRPASAGEAGEICITDLHNYAMPLVRYLNGDMAVRSDRRCECGRGLPLLEKVQGRTLDVIRTVDGRIVPGEFFVYAMLGFSFVSRYQFVQHALDSVEVRLVLGSPLTPEQRDALTTSIRDGLGATCRIEFTQVPDIPLTPSGKRRVAVSRIAGDAHGAHA